MTESPHLRLAKAIAAHFSKSPLVEAIAIGGSQSAGTLDQLSDIDLYIYTTGEVPLEFRETIVDAFGVTEKDMNLQFWDPGDEWIDAETGIEVDIIYWDTQWIDSMLERVLIQHQASMGYTTSFWHTILNSNCLYDRNGWFEAFQTKYKVPYPEKLRRDIISKNFKVLQQVIPSYFNQIAKAIKRQDAVSVNHRISALLASYFDVIFALNRVPNCGEKRIIPFILDHCQVYPSEMEEQITTVLTLASEMNPALLKKIETLITSLELKILEENLAEIIK
jgi:hypothetical protein